MEHHSDEIPLDIGFSLAGLLPMSIALNDANVRGGNVLKRFARDIGIVRPDKRRWAVLS